MSGEKCQRNTHQKSVILEYIKAHGSSHIRAEDILADLSSQGEPVGKATVYRFLKALEAEGQIRRYTISDKVPACYQYIGDQPECRQHCHLMCTCCGRLFHVENALIREFVRQTMEEDGFCVDESKTVFYGVCRECRMKEGGE